jgi:hypothetical protein
LFQYIANALMDRVDPLGLLEWPWKSCTSAGEDDVLDPAWKCIGFVPVGESPVAGGAGGSSYDMLKVRWMRGFKRKYNCCCSKVRWADGARGYARDMTEGAPFFFSGVPGPWTPIPSGSSLAEWFFETAGAAIDFVQLPWADTASAINAFVSKNAPGSSEKGDVVKDPKTPSVWCWW